MPCGADRRPAGPRLVEALPARLARLADGPVAVQHGDAHFWNVLFPRTEDDGGCVLIDWQLWRIGPPAFDLAYMIGLHGEPSWRDAMEIPLLEHCADAMRRRGISHPWPETWHDYRLGMAFVLLYPVLLHRMGVTEQVWGPHLRRGRAAFDDLGCAALLG